MGNINQSIGDINHLLVNRAERHATTSETEAAIEFPRSERCPLHVRVLVEHQSPIFLSSDEVLSERESRPVSPRRILFRVALSPDRCGDSDRDERVRREQETRNQAVLVRPVNNDGRFPSSSLTLVK